MKCPRLIISALRGGAGKTLVSIGICAAWTQAEQLSVSPFKKGPDYIDAGWLALAADSPCYNLDTFMIDKEIIRDAFLSRASRDISLIEGNRGLYDGIDMGGTTSTGELAKFLNLPVVLCIDCTKSTRTMAAAVLGCIHFDPEVAIKGVILNRVARPRHEAILRKSIEYHCGIPVVGAVPKLNRQSFPERHMGLVPTHEHEWAKDSVRAAARMAEQHLDLDALRRIAHEATGLSGSSGKSEKSDIPVFADAEKPKIGIIRDSAFQFYYPENFEALESAGAELIFLSPLDPDGEQLLRKTDALYIGGGFPETHAQALAENTGFRETLKSLAEKNFPIYAECGGLMYLGEKLIMKEKTYPMCGVVPIVFGFSKKPQAHGYTIVSVTDKNPYFEVGTELRGHEFHYSGILEWRGQDEHLVFSMKRGTGLVNGKDGVSYKNVLATYTHIHASGVPSWAKALVQTAISCRKRH